MVASIRLMCLLAACALSGACSSETSSPDDDSDSAPFIINSPLDGAQIGGTLWLSVQPTIPAGLVEVAFEAGT